MLIEGVKLSDGTVIPLICDDAGRLYFEGSISLDPSDSNIGNVDIASALPPGTNTIGVVRNALDVVDFTPTLDTAAYASGDSLWLPAAVPFATANGGKGLLHSLALIDTADQKQPLDIVFFSGPTPSFGAANAVMAIDDTDSLLYLHHTVISAADYYDMGGASVAIMSNIGVTLKAEATSQAVYVGAISRGTGTYAAGSLKVRLGIAAQN